MSSKNNILVFPCGSEIGLEINNALKWSTHIELFGASSVDDHGKYVYLEIILMVSRMLVILILFRR